MQDVVEMAIGGRATGTMFKGERWYDITICYLPEARTNITAIGSVLVPTREGGRDQGSFVADAQKRFSKEVTLPAGYEVSWGGQLENLLRAQKRLSAILPITIAIIFVLLYFMFGSAKYAGMVLMNVPFSLVVASCSSTFAVSISASPPP